MIDAVGMVLPYEISGWGENFWAFSGETRCLRPTLELLELLKKKSQSFCMKSSSESWAMCQIKTRKQAPKTPVIHSLAVLANKS